MNQKMPNLKEFSVKFNNKRSTWNNCMTKKELSVKLNASLFRLKMAQNIDFGQNFTFLKAGDGERDCMQGKKGHNCDGHSYSSELGIDLFRTYAYFSDKEDTLISQFPYCEPFLPTLPNQELFESLLFMEQNLDDSFIELWRTIKNSKRKKHFIGNESVYYAIKEPLKIDNHIKVVEKNAYFVSMPYDQIMKTVEKNDIVMISAGFPGKLMAQFIHASFDGDITILDTGSAFDPLVRHSRSGQISKEKAQQVLSNL